MKLLSKTLKKLRIAFSSPIEINNFDGNKIYYEEGNMVTYSKDSGYNDKKEFDENGTMVYLEDGEALL